uniref:Bardet-Biedl syndrome 5-like protein n=1 Tax=Romanomermis culicivorax TaxID=13658 RepID=A0A915L6W6_ROMCU
MAIDKPTKKLVFDSIWEDREVKFDIDINQMRLRAGEFLIDRLDNIEDTKGNNGDRGVMKITNLRIIWHAHSLPPIGYNCIERIESKVTNSHLRGQTESMELTTKKASNQFHFQFTCLHSGHSRLFATVSAVHRSS